MKLPQPFNSGKDSLFSFRMKKPLFAICVALAVQAPVFAAGLNQSSIGDRPQITQQKQTKVSSENQDKQWPFGPHHGGPNGPHHNDPYDPPHDGPHHNDPFGPHHNDPYDPYHDGPHHNDPFGPHHDEPHHPHHNGPDDPYVGPEPPPPPHFRADNQTEL